MPFHIGLLAFPDITQLDMTGPYEVFIKFPDAKVHLIWKSRQPVTAGGGMQTRADHDVCRMPAARFDLRAGRRGHERVAQRRRDARLYSASGERRALCDQRLHRRAGARRGGSPEGQARCDALDDHENAARLRCDADRERVVCGRQRDHRWRRHGGRRFRAHRRGAGVARISRRKRSFRHGIRPATLRLIRPFTGSSMSRLVRAWQRIPMHMAILLRLSSPRKGRAECRVFREALIAMTAPLPAAYEVRAHNGAAASENKIHDDTVAQRFGFKGALVPGVAVFAYHGAPAGCALGPRVSGARRGGLPVSEARVRRRDGAGDGGGRRRRHSRCWSRAAANAAPPGTPSMPPPREAPAIDSLPAGVPPAERPKASEESLGVGRALGIVPMVIDRAALLGLSRRDPRDRAALSRGRPGASGADSAACELRAAAERRAGALDPRRQHDPLPCAPRASAKS